MFAAGHIASNNEALTMLRSDVLAGDSVVVKACHRSATEMANKRRHGQAKMPNLSSDNIGGVGGVCW